MNSNLFWCIIGIVGGAVFSLIISLIFFLVGLKRKKLNYNIQTFCLVSKKINQIKGLEVKYNSKEIENLYSSTISIKNVGNSVIEKQDVSPSCPFSISTNGVFLLNNVNDTNLYSSNKTNHVFASFNIDESNNETRHIILNFEYIAKKEEWTYTVLHTGDITFDGVLKDGKISNIAKKEIFIDNVSLSLIKTIIDIMTR